MTVPAPQREDAMGAAGKRGDAAGLAAGTLSLRIDLPEGRIGPGKVKLLEAIEREGSISGAGRALGMSYKRAWDLVDALNKMFGVAMVEASAGGARGGGASLTEAGRQLVADYRAIERAAQRAAGQRLKAMRVRVGRKRGAPSA
jgi:molybdate transport system regulatory protein